MFENSYLRLKTRFFNTDHVWYNITYENPTSLVSIKVVFHWSTELIHTHTYKIVQNIILESRDLCLSGLQEILETVFSRNPRV